MTGSRKTNPSESRLWLNDLVIVAAAVVCAMITWLLTARLGGIALAVTLRHGTVQTVSGGDVALMAAVAAIIGLLVLRGLEWVSALGLRIWTIGAVVLAAVSLLGTLGAGSAAATGALMALHGVVAAVVIVGGHRAHRARTRRPR